MKALLPLIVLFAATGCAKNHKAQDLVTTYVKAMAHDPSSYEAVAWGGPYEESGGKATITHVYRAKNSFGALVRTTSDFKVDSVSGEVELVDPEEEMKKMVSDGVRLGQKLMHESNSKADAQKREMMSNAERIARKLEHDSDSIADAQQR